MSHFKVFNIFAIFAIFAIFGLCLIAGVANAQTPATGDLQGRVVTPAGVPVAAASLHLVDLHLRTESDAQGHFQFLQLAPGSYLLEVESLQEGKAVLRATVQAGSVSELEVVVALVRHEDEIVVTASGDARSQLELAQPTTVLSGEDLSFRLRSSLGETLAQEPGVAATSFGAGASRPVIRGMGGDRVRMLQGGLGVGDASSISPDHAVAIEPAFAERIEVLHGPSTLLYGSSAIGGVVNVIDSTIPEDAPTQALSGFVELRGGTAAEEKSAVAGLDGGSARWAWHLEGLRRETGDYDIPGFAEVAGPGREEHGTLSNSDISTSSIGLGVTHFFKSPGFLGISVSDFTSDYGIPGAAHAHEDGHEEDSEEQLRIDLQRRRYDLRSEIPRSMGPFRGLKLRLGVVDYEHAELEGAAGEVGTTFFNDSREGRLELILKPRGALSGSLGLQLDERDLEAVGDEAFIPPTEVHSWAAFAFQELDRGAIKLQFGGRFERQTADTQAAELRDRSFSGVSASLGLVWLPDDVYSLGFSLARSLKTPSAEELYSDGAHFATQSFERGNDTLGEESSLGLDVSLRKKTGRLTGVLNFYFNRFADYIFPAFTGEEEDGLPVVRVRQEDAKFVGAELKTRLGLWERASADDHLDLTLIGDVVRAELRDSGDPLPRIPPLRLGMGLHYHNLRWHTYAEVQWTDDQDRIAAHETSTAGSTVVNAGLSYRLFHREQVYDFLLRGQNLTDEEVRNHVSFLKDRVPLPGRDISVALRLAF